VSKKHTETPDEFPAIPEPQPKVTPTTRLPTENEVAPSNPCEPEAAELDQDPGGGYNPDGTYPQT
jgi:hypothetical protein